MGTKAPTISCELWPSRNFVMSVDCEEAHCARYSDIGHYHVPSDPRVPPSRDHRTLTLASNCRVNMKGSGQKFYTLHGGKFLCVK